MHSTGNIIADTICRTAELGLAITGDYTRIEADATAYTDRCPTCDNTGIFRDHAYRTLIDLPIVGFPTRLHVRLPRYRCTMTDCDVNITKHNLPVLKQVKRSPTGSPAGSSNV